MSARRFYNAKSRQESVGSNGLFSRVLGEGSRSVASSWAAVLGGSVSVGTGAWQEADLRRG